MKNTSDIYILIGQRLFIYTYKVEKVQHSFGKKKAGHKYILIWVVECCFHENKGTLYLLFLTLFYTLFPTDFFQ